MRIEHLRVLPDARIVRQPVALQRFLGLFHLLQRHGGGVGAARLLRGTANVVPNDELVTIVNTGDDLADLYVMAQCSRHVISNSTYSWWGAMLSGSDDVVWPDPWSQMHQPSAQLCPPRWKRIAGAVDRTNLAPRFANALSKTARWWGASKTVAR